VLNYDAPTQFGAGVSLISNFSVTYEGNKYVQVHNLAETGETTLVNLRLGIRSDDGWSIVAFGRNLTDEDTIPLATRWFDLRTGTLRSCATFAAPCVPTSPPQGTVGGADVGSPRAFFGAPRRGRTFGLEFNYDFKL
jgi:outer membrane receptor protein involved in Fe transport